MRRVLAAVILAVAACAGSDPNDAGIALTLGRFDEDIDDSTSGEPVESSSSPELADDTSGGDDSGSSEGDGDGDDGGGSTSSDAPAQPGLMVTCPADLESFGGDPGWLVKNLPDGKNDYGWRAGTTNAGGNPGEIGGRIQRSTHRSSYAHVIAPLDFSSCIHASGRLVIPRLDPDFRSRVSFGHFDGLGGPHVGFDVANEDIGRVRVFVMAGGLSELAFIIDQPTVPLTWTYTWDPMTSTMTLTLDGIGTAARTLTPAEAGAILGLDRFGIRHDDHDNAANHPGVMKVFLDEIEYTR